jgi:hypothetical protein
MRKPSKAGGLPRRCDVGLAVDERVGPRRRSSGTSRWTQFWKTDEHQIHRQVHQPLTDRGVRVISRLQKLERLNLSGSQVTDVAVDDLIKLKNLQFLGIADSPITVLGVERLRQALPQCHVGGYGGIQAGFASKWPLFNPNSQPKTARFHSLRRRTTSTPLRRLSAAPISWLTCPGFLAPTMAAVTAGCRKTQAMATSPGDLPCRLPMPRSTSTKRKFRENNGS